MTKPTNTLNCKFKDSLGKTRGMNIDNPLEGVAPEQLETFMNFLIETNVMMTDIKTPEVHYELIGGAKRSSKIEEEINFA